MITQLPGGVYVNVAHPDDHISRFHALQQWYEPDLLADLTQRLPDEGVFVDVGAHVGNHTLWAVNERNATVIAVEPNAASLRQLLESVRLNGWERQVRTVWGALGERTGTATLNVNARNTGDTRLTVDPDGLVKVDTFDSLALPAVDVVKIDVQGWETAVLRGAPVTLTTHRPVLYVEADTVEAQTAVDAAVDPFGYVRSAKFGITPTWRYDPQ